MSKIIPVRVWQLLASLVAITISITVYAYKNDNTYQDKNIEANTESIKKIEIKCKEFITKEEFGDKMSSHNEIQTAQIATIYAQLNSIQQSSDDTKMLVQKLLNIELNKKK